MAGKRELILRNQRMDLYKGAAIYAVIAIHILFPGDVGIALRVLGRFGVPFFFLTAGYFNLGASQKALLRRCQRAFLQLFLACVPYLILGLVLTIRQGTPVADWLRSVFSLTALKNFILFHAIPLPYAWQLWFLGALAFVYLMWWAITTLYHTLNRPFPYTPLAVLSAILLTLHLFCGEGFGLLGKEVDTQFLRNALLDGLPFFALGNWAAWNRKRIKALHFPWLFLVPIGGVLSLAEAYFAGKQELYLGTILLLIGMMGHCIRYRRISDHVVSQLLCFCGQELTLPIFAIHMLVIAALNEIPALNALHQVAWLLPVLVAVVSTLIAFVLVWAKAVIQIRRIHA